MFNILQAYWDWRNKFKFVKKIFETEYKYTVERFEKDKWAVKGMIPGQYKDLKGNFQWSRSSSYFKDCLGSKSTIEERFGKILGLEEDE